MLVSYDTMLYYHKAHSRQLTPLWHTSYPDISLDTEGSAETSHNTALVSDDAIKAGPFPTSRYSPNNSSSVVSRIDNPFDVTFALCNPSGFRLQQPIIRIDHLVLHRDKVRGAQTEWAPGDIHCITHHEKLDTRDVASELSLSKAIHEHT